MIFFKYWWKILLASNPWPIQGCLEWEERQQQWSYLQWWCCHWGTCKSQCWMFNAFAKYWWKILLTSNPYLSKDVLNERDCSSDEVVCSDGVTIRARARVDVEGPAATWGRAHWGRGKGWTVPALALIGLNPLAAGGDVVPVCHWLSHNVGPEGGSAGASACIRTSSSAARVALVQVKEVGRLEWVAIGADTVAGKFTRAWIEFVVKDPLLDDWIVDDVPDGVL